MVGFAKIWQDSCWNEGQELVRLSATEVAQFEARLGLKLPPVYRQFIVEFGHVANTSPFGDFEVSTDDVLRNREYLVRTYGGTDRRLPTTLVPVVSRLGEAYILADFSVPSDDLFICLFTIGPDLRSGELMPLREYLADLAAGVDTDDPAMEPAFPWVGL